MCKGFQNLVYCSSMSKLSRDDVLKLARLSRISLTDDEVDSFADELSAILGYVEQLSAVDVEDLTPTHQVTGLKNVMREDEVIDYGYKPADLLAGAPDRQGDYIKVRRMIG